jgi:hypothetical protein
MPLPNELTGKQLDAVHELESVGVVFADWIPLHLDKERAYLVSALWPSGHRVQYTLFPSGKLA